VLGHEERFPPTRLSAGCGFRKETIAGMRRNGRDAPVPAVRPRTRGAVPRGGLLVRAGEQWIADDRRIDLVATAMGLAFVEEIWPAASKRSVVRMLAFMHAKRRSVI
jgi:hypothetical protein